MKWEVGDRVKVVYENHVFFGCEGVIISFMAGKYPNVKLDPGQKAKMIISEQPWLFNPATLELVDSD